MRPKQAPTAQSTSVHSAISAGAQAMHQPALSSPRVYEGTGDDVIDIDMPPGLGIVVFECPKSTGRLVVRSDGLEGLLVYTNGVDPSILIRKLDYHASGLK